MGWHSPWGRQKVEVSLIPHHLRTAWYRWQLVEVVICSSRGALMTDGGQRALIKDEFSRNGGLASPHKEARERGTEASSLSSQREAGDRYLSSELIRHSRAENGRRRSAHWHRHGAVRRQQSATHAYRKADRRDRSSNNSTCATHARVVIGSWAHAACRCPTSPGVP